MISVQKQYISERVKELQRQYVRYSVLYIQFNDKFYKLCTLQVGNLHSNRLQYSIVYSNDMIYINFVLRVMELEASQAPHEFIYI